MFAYLCKNKGQIFNKRCFLWNIRLFGYDVDFENSVKAKEIFYANPDRFVSKDEFVKMIAKSVGGI